MGVLGIILLCIVLYFIFSSGKAKANIPEINRVNSIKDIVMSVNHGRIYPFYTRMNLIRAKNAAKIISPDITRLEQNLQLYELMGVAPYFDLDIQNNYVERISVMLNKNGLVSSISIDIKNFDVNMKPLAEEMAIKFGRPASMSDEFIIWREACMVINLSKNGSLSVIDESIFGR